MEDFLSHFAPRLGRLGRWLLAMSRARTAFDKEKDGVPEPAKPIEMLPPAFL